MSSLKSQSHGEGRVNALCFLEHQPNRTSVPGTCAHGRVAGRGAAPRPSRRRSSECLEEQSWGGGKGPREAGVLVHRTCLQVNLPEIPCPVRSSCILHPVPAPTRAPAGSGLIPSFVSPATIIWPVTAKPASSAPLSKVMSSLIHK